MLRIEEEENLIHINAENIIITVIEYIIYNYQSFFCISIHMILIFIALNIMKYFT